VKPKGSQPVSGDRRFAVWIGATAGLFLLTMAVGFVWLPSAQPGAAALDWWKLICDAAGWPEERSSFYPNITGTPASTVSWTPATRTLLNTGDATRGASLASTCESCHGSNGVSADAIFPNLVGQDVAALYKQLEDFKSGKRNAAVMGVYVSGLSGQDMLDLATYFASLPNPFAGKLPPENSDTSLARELVEKGSPSRGLAPCSACHGPVAYTVGAPGLQGQQRAYLEQQLQALAAGTRHNDINQQMRSVAQQLTDAEISQLSVYYSSVPQ
jgi:cytochrome c553